MQAALVAAKAEIEAANAQPAPCRSAVVSDEPSREAKTPECAEPVSVYGGDLLEPSEPPDTPEAQEPEQIPSDLDPETLTKLKLLRRLNPNQKVEELLTQIEAEKQRTARAKPKSKRGWFRRR